MANTNVSVSTAMDQNPDPPVTVEYVHDRGGNLIFDGEFFYQFDGFNRLVQVNQAGALIASDFVDGQLDLTQNPPPEPGDLVAAFVYDGLGRLIQTKRYDDSGEFASEDYYYDGVRRIEEVVDRPDGQGGREEVLREYVYGPGYVYEIVYQIVESGGPAACFYYLQDANYNVVAILDGVGGVVCPGEQRPASKCHVAPDEP